MLKIKISPYKILYRIDGGVLILIVALTFINFKLSTSIMDKSKQILKEFKK